MSKEGMFRISVILLIVGTLSSFSAGKDPFEKLGERLKFLREEGSFDFSTHNSIFGLAKALAEQGDQHAQYAVAWMYYFGWKPDNGDEILEDREEAAIWYRKSADQGNVESQAHLGMMYGAGIGVKKSDKEAVMWYRKAAEQGHAGTQWLLGVSYDNGKGVKKNHKEAEKWLQLAAKQDHAAAQADLGRIYYHGKKGVKKDMRKAAKWLLKAAEKGHAESQYVIGRMHIFGNGVLEDHILAWAWFNIAGANGWDVSKIKHAFSENLTYAQITEGQKLSREMVEANPKLISE